ncbi:CD63 antigen-like [Uranotaenia lowii]|uniref:CD63 antigen-like n=1 Tax=Uranotaenia lowii TaxID=190385 RepID=UPI002479307F|nr:CD63 antigen-like [Uranotaenia lowii]
MKAEHHSGSWSMKWIKFFLFMTNVMFVFTAILVISTGAAVQSIYSDFTNFIDDQFYSPTLMFIFIGVITLLIATFGFIGTIRESTLLINIYCGLLSVVFLLEVTATLVGVYHREELDGLLVQTMNSSIQHYAWNSHLQESVDFMQIELECCGIRSWTDWENVFAVIDLDNGNTRAELPASCCATYLEGECVPFVAGCYPRMLALLTHCSRTVISGILLVAFVQISSAMFAFMLAKRIRLVKTKLSLSNVKYENTGSFDYRRLQELTIENSKDHFFK